MKRKPWNATRNPLDSIEEQIPAKPTEHIKIMHSYSDGDKCFHRNRRRTTKGECHIADSKALLAR